MYCFTVMAIVDLNRFQPRETSCPTVMKSKEGGIWGMVNISRGCRKRSSGDDHRQGSEA